MTAAEGRRVFNAAQAAEYLGCAESTIYRWAKQGRIPSVVISSRRFFPEFALADLLARQCEASLQPALRHQDGAA